MPEHVFRQPKQGKKAGPSKRETKAKAYVDRISELNSPIDTGLWSDNQARRAVNVYLDGGGFTMSPQNKRDAILEMMNGWTVIGEENAILALLEQTTPDERDVIFGAPGGVDRAQLLRKFQGKNARRLELLYARWDASPIEPESSYDAYLQAALEQASDRDARIQELQERREITAARRQKMDDDSVFDDYPRDEVDKRVKFEEEMMKVRRLEPIKKVDVTEDAITLHANFEIRFEGVDDVQAKSRLFGPAKAALHGGIDRYWNHVIGSDKVKWSTTVIDPEASADAAESEGAAVRYKRDATLPPPPDQLADESFDDYLNRVRKDIVTIQKPIVNRDMINLPFAGREFSIKPNVQWISASTKADPTRAWLYSIRSSESAPLEFEGVNIEGAETEGIENKGRISKTLTELGAVSMSSTKATDPLTYAHELLHLFGLVDRYGYIGVTGDTFAVRTERPTENLTMDGNERVTTAGRPDPLGLEKGPILDEDLMHVLSGTGVFEQEIYRGLDEIHRLDQSRERQVSRREIEAELENRKARKRGL